MAAAGTQALAALYPRWHIWADPHGWHARRRGSYLQGYQHGAPAFCVHAGSPAALAAQLYWQQAAETHVPFGCSGG
jgi:hypothetical protein